MGNSKSTTASADPEIKAYIEKENQSHKVVIWAKTYCGYCSKTTKLFQELGIEAKCHNIDQDARGSQIQDTLEAMTGQRTVPNVFVNAKHLGGCDDTQSALKSGKLQKMLG